MWHNKKLVLLLILGLLINSGCAIWKNDKIKTADGEVITVDEMWEDMRK